MSRSVVPGFRLLVVVLAILLGGCGVRPSFDEATRELERLISPAVASGLGKIKPTPTPLREPQSCADPFVGPSDGLRPIIDYEVPFESLPEGPDEFIVAVEEAWIEEGRSVESDDTSEVKSRRVSHDGYRAEAVVNLKDGIAYLGGSGPCVDSPKT